MQIVKRHQDEIEIKIFGVLQLLWQHKIRIIFTAIIFAAAAFAATYYLITPEYTASITMYANNNSDTADRTTTISYSDITASVQLVDTYAAIILTDPVLDQVISEVGLDVDADKLIKKISVEAVNDTEVFKVSVEDTSPERAAEIANKISELAPAKIESIVNGCSVKIVSGAKVPTKKTSPNYILFTLFGAIVGFVLCCFRQILKAILDTRIKSEEDLKEFDLPMLSNIPDFNKSAKGKEYGYY